MPINNTNSGGKNRLHDLPNNNSNNNGNQLQDFNGNSIINQVNRGDINNSGDTTSLEDFEPLDNQGFDPENPTPNNYSGNNANQPPLPNTSNQTPNQNTNLDLLDFEDPEPQPQPQPEPQPQPQPEPQPQPQPQPQPSVPRFEKMNNFYFIKENVLNLLKALQFGPVVVAHFVSESFKFYESGVFDGRDCSDTPLDFVNHSAVIVGYDLNARIPFFRLKNSWGDDWGEKGYYRMKIGELISGNMGICRLAGTPFAVMPTVE